ncbi:MAG: CBS domain-containing protein [Desulfitobacterium sp.]|nr:CBS domain-containing protein [Desulfitobacterium sp.]
MNVILTHRQMDFDALASMVAAHKIYPNSVMVVDGKSNPYVQDFLALAKDRLPFSRSKDINWTEVKRIILVDTHNLQRAGGYKEDEVIRKIPLVIYDHHPYQGKFDENIYIESLGSCTTLLIEEMQRLKIEPNSFEATLFALGIYEDTGSLLFESTTVRDIKAVAYLLEKGANLGVVAEYLRKPLHDEQKEILQQLLDHGQSEIFQGQPVYITWAEKDEYVGGLALLAHRVGEVEGAETLFLVVAMENRVYLIGRSRGRGFDVNNIIRAFGGAGHSRAASASIKNTSIHEVTEKLKEELQNQSYQGNSVRDIMSYPVKTVPPDMKLRDVEQILLKYGHTGVPVAKDNKLVGIISRRDVDKSLKHGLEHAPVKGFMTKDVIVVDANASWEDAHKIMVQHDIGRIPVVDEGKLVGIVSRSDILRMVHGSAVPTELSLTRNRSMAMREDILLLLENLPQRIRLLIKSAQKVADNLGYPLFIVGGFVRDLLLLAPTQDLDFVVEGDGKAFAKALQKELGEGELIFHDQFGTARLEFADGNHLDIARSRREDYASPGALPQVEESRLRDDMFRRDFTINAMAIAINSQRYGELIDYYGGLRDLKQGEIRFLHNLSFIEDPTRILRALRFAARYGFRIAKETQEAIYIALENGVLGKLSCERFTEEFSLMLYEEKFGLMGKFLMEMGILEEWFQSELPWDFSHPILNHKEILPEKKWLLSLRKMDTRHLPLLQERLRLAREWGILTMKYLEIQDKLKKLRATSALPLKELDEIFWSAPPLLLDVFQLDDQWEKEILRYKERVENIQQSVNGTDLMAWGVKEGPEIGRMLKEIRTAWLEEKVKNKTQERAFVQKLLEDYR